MSRLVALFERWRSDPSSQNARGLLAIHFAQRLRDVSTVDAAYYRVANQVQDDYISLSDAEKAAELPVAEAYIADLKLARNFLRREVIAGHVMDSARLWRDDGGQTWAHAAELLDLATAGDENITVTAVHNAYNTRTGMAMALFGQRNLTAAQRSQVITDMHAAAMFMLHALHRAEAATSPDAALQRKRRRILPDSSI